MDTPKKIGRYEILEELGHGAMGTVYRAKDPAMDRVVALKTIIALVLSSDQGSDFRERFYREARAAGALAHPGIVPVFDVGEHEGLPFLVMEFISGKTLADAMKKGERMTLDRVCEMGQKIAEALGYAHQHGVVHRDIKPANILLTSKEAHGIERPKITDFGVAKLAAGHTTLTGQILGTPAFMPPEQFTGAPIDGRADIFSLGVVLYWMATGEQPFPGESMTAVSYKVVHTDPVPPRRLNPSIPLKLEGIILKCLAKNPDERYQTGEDLARDLGELRTVSTSMGLKSAAPEMAADGSDPNATYVEKPAPTQAGGTKAPQPPEHAVAPKSNSNNLLVLAALVIVVIVAGSWYLLRRQGTPTVQVAPPSAARSEAQPVPAPALATANESVAKQAAGAAEPAPAPPSSNVPAAAKPASSAPKKPETNVVAAEKTPPPKAKIPAPKAEAATPEPAAVDFNPKSLDPKANARLKIDAVQVPAGLDFTVEMNGKLYLRRSAEGNKMEFDDLYVPPGVQEFRVTAASGSVHKSSNTVSTEFTAKKRHTLKIELRTQGTPTGAGVPQGLYADTQIVLTLK
ncbi:MAG TPA: serine/threonine-protein kinase [Verrucomicrobiae bacterium]|nr:serine/threonine-protein kinase [Verrucomicrobiae bacterium]